MGILYDVYKITEGYVMNGAITPSEFEERMLTIRETSRTENECLYRMHGVVIELLVDLGYEDGADIYEETVMER